LQWKAAQKGNTSILIWLGKQYLNQRDQPKEEENNEALDKLINSLNRHIGEDKNG